MTSNERAPTWIRRVALVGAAVAATLLMLPAAHPGVAPGFSLYWGDQIAAGVRPQFDVPYADTPHPLANAIGALLALSGNADLGYRWLCALTAIGVVLLIARLTWRLLGWLAAIIAVALVVTRLTILDQMVLSYHEALYALLLLAALVVAVERPRSTRSVLLLLAAAGLLQPAAWALSAAYAIYVWRWSGSDVRWIELAALVLLAPALWLLADWILAGDPLHSFSRTRTYRASLERDTGLFRAIVELPNLLAIELSRIVSLIGAVGCVIAWWVRRRSATPLLVALLATVLTFFALSAAGFSVVSRYVFVPSLILAAFAAFSLVGWVGQTDHRLRRRWLLGSLPLWAAVAVFVPKWAHDLHHQSRNLGVTADAYADLKDIADRGVIGRDCGPYAVPLVETGLELARWLDIPLDQLRPAELDKRLVPLPPNDDPPKRPLPPRGYVIVAKSARLTDVFRELNTWSVSYRPPGRRFKLVYSDQTWAVYRDCRPAS